MMPFLLAQFANLEQLLPLYVCCVGSHAQKHLDRPEGYPAHQIFLSRSGYGRFRIDGRQELRLSPGTILFLPANTPHEYYPERDEENWELGFVAFRGFTADPLLLQMDELIMNTETTRHFDSLWDQLESLWYLISQNGEHAYWESSKRMYNMMLTILEGQSALKKASKNESPSRQANAALQTAVQLMHEHYNERLALANVARSAGYSVQHFHRLFVEQFGVTPQQYILQLRMRKSMELLQEQSGITIEKIAEIVGMETSYFIRMFKRTFGKTPKQYLLNH
ncbi:AraC family transcriptional regulator [Paenibacillus sp. YAF4_2]|uniref:helix-turn-helix domain-containing protein n=1 Tax=Paenibacillus sp. YAF4_2 TaxID=3233085 RepID=UPI003F94DA5C